MSQMKPLEATRGLIAEYYRVRNLNPGGAFQDPLTTDQLADEALALVNEVQDLRRKVAMLQAEKMEINNLVSQLSDKVQI